MLTTAAGESHTVRGGELTDVVIHEVVTVTRLSPARVTTPGTRQNKATEPPGEVFPRPLESRSAEPRPLEERRPAAKSWESFDESDPTPAPTFALHPGARPGAQPHLVALPTLAERTPDDTSGTENAALEDATILKAPTLVGLEDATIMRDMSPLLAGRPVDTGEPADTSDSAPVGPHTDPAYDTSGDRAPNPTFDTSGDPTPRTTFDSSGPDFGTFSDPDAGLDDATTIRPTDYVEPSHGARPGYAADSSHTTEPTYGAAPGYATGSTYGPDSAAGPDDDSEELDDSTIFQAPDIGLPPAPSAASSEEEFDATIISTSPERAALSALAAAHTSDEYPGSGGGFTPVPAPPAFSTTYRVAASNESTVHLSPSAHAGTGAPTATIAPAPVVTISDCRGTVAYPIVDALYVGRAPEPPTDAPPSARALAVVESPSESVSSTHLRMRRQGEQVLVWDMWSTNGTTVNPPSAGPYRLGSGEELAVTPGTWLDLGDGVRISVGGARVP